VQAGLLSAEDAQGLAHDLDALNARGEFRGSFVVYMAVARKRAGS
jgi:hypothetical protein